MTTNNTHPLKQAERAAHDAFAAAMHARDAIEVCGSPEWLAAHKVAGELAKEWTAAKLAVYAEAARLVGAGQFPYEILKTGLEFRPYWF